MVKSIETLAQNLPIPKNQTSIKLWTPNLIISTTKIVTSLFNGLSVNFNDTTETSQGLGESITLPRSLFHDTNTQVKEETKLGSVLFFSSSFFSEKGFDETTNASSTLNSRIVSISINGVKIKHLHTEPLRIRYRPFETDTKGVPICVFWDFQLNGKPTQSFLCVIQTFLFIRIVLFSQASRFLKF